MFGFGMKKDGLNRAPTLSAAPRTLCAHCFSPMPPIRSCLAYSMLMTAPRGLPCTAPCPYRGSLIMCIVAPQAPTISWCPTLELDLDEPAWSARFGGIRWTHTHGGIFPSRSDLVYTSMSKPNDRPSRSNLRYLIPTPNLDTR
jgi:hypothetical protein